MYRIIVPSRMVGRKLATLDMALGLPKEAKIIIVSRKGKGIKSEVKTREQLIEEIKKEINKNDKTRSIKRIKKKLQ